MVDESNELDDGRRGMSLEDVPCSHVVVVESNSSERAVAGHCPKKWSTVSSSIDGVEMIVESTEVDHHAKDGSVARLVLGLV